VAGTPHNRESDEVFWGGFVFFLSFYDDELAMVSFFSDERHNIKHMNEAWQKLKCHFKMRVAKEWKEAERQLYSLTQNQTSNNSVSMTLSKILKNNDEVIWKRSTR